jgi:hypothetical protein
MYETKSRSREAAMRIKRHEDVTPAVLKVMQQTKNPRLREIMLAAVSHLHAFVREVRLTEEEFREAAALLAELGQRTTDNHNETVLMAGSLGISSLPDQQRRRRHHRDLAESARTVLAAEFTAGQQWGIDRA